MITIKNTEQITEIKQIINTESRTLGLWTKAANNNKTNELVIDNNRQPNLTHNYMLGAAHQNVNIESRKPHTFSKGLLYVENVIERRNVKHIEHKLNTVIKLIFINCSKFKSSLYHRRLLI